MWERLETDAEIMGREKRLSREGKGSNWAEL